MTQEPVAEAVEAEGDTVNLALDAKLIVPDDENIQIRKVAFGLTERPTILMEVDLQESVGNTLAVKLVSSGFDAATLQEVLEMVAGTLREAIEKDAFTHHAADENTEN